MSSNWKVKGNVMVEDDFIIAQPLNVSVVMLNRRTALLEWWPRDAFMHKDIEIVFTPEDSKYVCNRLPDI